MLSQMNVGLTYNGEQRLKDIILGLKEDFDRKIIDKLLDEAIVKSRDGLKGIEKDINELELKVRAIRADGSANKYLIFEDQCRKLLTKLDAIPLDTEEDKQRRKNDIQLIISCSAELKKSSVDNLRQLLFCVEKLDVHKVYKDVYRQIQEFIDKSKGSTITEVDDQRFKLEEIKQKVID